MYGCAAIVTVRLGNGDGTFGADSTTVLNGAWYPTQGPFANPRYWLSLRLADVNGDGRSDLIGEYDDGTSASVTGSCLSGGTLKSRTTRAAFTHLSTGNGTFGGEYNVFTRYQYYLTDGKPCGGLSAPLGDLNADGNADVFAWLSASNGAFIAPPTTFFPTTGGTLRPDSGLVDVNGDGKDDYYARDISAGTVTIWWSDGGNGFPTASSIPWSTTATESPIGFTDINGDGLADFYGWRDNGNIEIRLNTSLKPDIITTITNGLGAQHSVQYKPLSDPTAHQRAVSVAYPYRPVNDSTYVVRAASKSDGLGGWLTTGYFYAGYLMHVTSRQPVGFNWIQRVEPDGSWTNDYYNQTLETSGTLLKSETFVSGARLVKRISNDWILGTTGISPNIIAFRLRQVKEENWGLLGEVISSTTTDTTYDPYGFPVTSVVNRGSGRKTTTTNTYEHDGTYWLLGLKTREQVTAQAPNFPPQTRTTAYAYFPGTGLLASETIEPDVPLLRRLTEYGYDPFGNRGLTRVSGTGITTRATENLYDPTGRFITKTTNALGHFEVSAWDAGTGKPVTQTGPNGLSTYWEYDGFGRKIMEWRPDGTSTSTEYHSCDTSCPANAVMRIATSIFGGETRWVYQDVLGREIQTARTGFNGAWVYTTTSYDNLGRVAGKSHLYYGAETPHLTTTTFDLLHRPLTVTAPGNRVTTYSYLGREESMSNPLGQTTKTLKDVEGRVVEVTDALGQITRRIYDPFGNLASVTDPVGNTVSHAYDSRGRRFLMSHPDLGGWEYDYNVLDQMVWQTDAKGQVTTFEYDLLGRMTRRMRADGTTTWAYDTRPYGKGKIESAIAPGARTDTYYDNRGRVSQTTTVIGTSNYTMTTEYDLYSRPYKTTYPTGFRTKNIYDNYGHLKAVWSDSLATNVRYWKADTVDGHGRTSRESLGNGLVTTRTYDPVDDDLELIDTKTTGGTVVQSQSYLMDAVRNVSSRTWYDGGVNRTESFGYDALNRLKTVSGPANRDYSYDSAGNITWKSDVGTYVYPPTGSVRPHAMTTIQGSAAIGYSQLSFTYDANGNMLTGDGRTQTWTSFNKVKTSAKGGFTSTFTYGPADERVRTSVNGAGSTDYVGKSFERYVAFGTTDRHYVYAGKRLVGVYTGGTFEYYHADHLGSVELKTSSTGSAVQRISYDTYGKPRNANGTDGTVTAPPRGYTGLEHDHYAGLINMDAREQDPKLGRFLSADPLGTDGDPNPYAYANNNPLKYVDPTGTSFVSSFDFGGGCCSSSYLSSYQPSYASMQTNQFINSTNQFINSTQQYINNYYSSAFANTYTASSWNSYNSGPSIGSNLWGNTSPTTTSYSLFSNSGVGGYNDPFSSLGAGWATGVPVQPVQNNSWQYLSGLTLSGTLGGAMGLGVAGSVNLDLFSPRQSTVEVQSATGYGWFGGATANVNLISSGELSGLTQTVGGCIGKGWAVCGSYSWDISGDGWNLDVGGGYGYGLRADIATINYASELDFGYDRLTIPTPW